MKALGDLEAAVMSVLWAADGALTVRDVQQTLRVERDYAYNTVLTVLDHLHGKGLVDRKLHGRAHHYTASIDRAGFTAALMEEALAGAPGGDRQGALLRFVQRLDPADAQALADAVRGVRRQRRS